MKAHELKELTLVELNSRLIDEKKTLKTLVFKQSVSGQLENPAQLKLQRREIARLLTIINEKQRA